MSLTVHDIGLTFLKPLDILLQVLSGFNETLTYNIRHWDCEIFYEDDNEGELFTVGRGTSVMYIELLKQKSANI